MMSEFILPVYSLANPAAESSQPAPDDFDSQALPTYTRTTGPAQWDVPAVNQEHHFSMSTKTSSPWLALTMRSRATSEIDPPTFFQGGEIAGFLRLDLDKNEPINEITVVVYGKLSIFSHPTSNFLYMSRTLYSAAQPNTDLPILKHNKLTKGHHEWPYSFRLPKGVSILSSVTTGGEGQRETYRLPPSFSDARSDVHVEYSLVVRVSRGGLRPGRKLTVPFKYTPIARPSSPTILRQLAYQQNTAVVGPEGDPAGWKALEAVKVEGTLFKTISVNLQCNVYVSRPLTYARGCPIHMIVSVKTHNRQLWDLVTPQSLHVALVQRITFGETVGTVRFSRRLPGQLTVKRTECTTASWWRISGSTGESGSEKVFEGEVLIPGDLVPACQILHYGHEYELAFYPLTMVGFTPTMPLKTALTFEPVGIVTAYAQGPRPRSYIPPAYRYLSCI